MRVFLRPKAILGPFLNTAKLLCSKDICPKLRRLFVNVVAIDPNSAGAYANLAVVYMREKKWNPALAMLQKAEAFSPDVPGIKLNIGSRVLPAE